MEWLIASLLAVMFFSLVNILDKILVSRPLRRSETLIVYKSVVWAATLLAIPFIRFVMPSPLVLFLIICAAIVAVIAFLPYLVAMAHEEASRVVPLLQIQSIFVLLFSTFFLGERLAAPQLAAFALILLGSFLISVRDAKTMFVPSKALLLMLLATMLWGANMTLSSYIYKNSDLWSSVILGLAVSGIAGLVLLARQKTRADFSHSLRSTTPGQKLLLAADCILHVLGVLCISYALKHGLATLVSVISGLQSVFVFLFAILLTHTLPHLMEEEKTHRTLLAKAISILIILAGVWLLSTA